MTSKHIMALSIFLSALSCQIKHADQKSASNQTNSDSLWPSSDFYDSDSCDDGVVFMASNPGPKYPPTALRDSIHGQLFLEVGVDETGKVVAERVHKSLRGDCDSAALNVIKSWQYIPATLHGKHVKARVLQCFRFRLR